jgi:uncharacterized DUF497 family protein
VGNSIGEGLGDAHRGFEWDEAKRRSSILKHGFDFLDDYVIFDGSYFETPARQTAGEARYSVTGVLQGVYVTIIMTRQGDSIRVISMRRARTNARA